MADQTIDQLTDGGNIQTGDEIPAVRNGADYKIKANSILSRLDNLEISQGKNKGTFATANDLPIATNGDYAFVIATTSTWIYNNTWIDTEQDLKDNSLNKNNNLSELTDKAIARTNLDVYSKNEINTSLDLKADKTTTYTKTDADTLLSNKVDKIPGKDLSTNDFDNNYKSQVDENTTNRHNHTNKALLDTYTQTEIDLADAVLKKHTHSNKIILDNITASYTIEEQTKLTQIEAQATKNKTDTFLLDRQNHTGEQAISTITNLNIELASKQPMITQGTVAQYFKGDLSLSNFADDSRSAVINDNISAGNTTYSSNEINNRINKLPVGVGSGVTYYLTATESSIVGYDNMTLTPDTNAEVIESVVVNNNKILIDSYVSSQALNRNVLDAGIWTFNLWGTVANNNGQSYFIIDVYLRTDTGTETLLFTANSTVLNTEFTLTNTEIVHEAINTNLTDYLVIKISGFTTRSTDTTINLYHSGEIHYSHIHTPLIHQHNNLVGLQGGNANEKYHLTNSQYINATQFANTSQGGLLSSSDWNSFNNKADQTNTYTKTEVDIALNTKVDKITGKGLSTEDYTTTEKNKVANLPNNTISELNTKQNSTDNSLNTIDKTIVGAINENKTNIDLKADKVTTYTKTETDNLLNEKLNISLKGQANGLAELDAAGKVPSDQLPSFVDDILEYDNITLFPTIGETGKIYVAKDTNIIYRWSGTQYTEISSSLALGETSSTAYRGDKGKTAYDHSQIVNANPHNTSKADIGLSNVVNVDTTTTANITDSLNKRFVSDAEKTKIENTYTKTDTDNLLLNKVDKITGKGLSTNDLTDTLKSNYDNAFTNSHTHSNKTLLDTYTQTEANLSDAVLKKHEHTNKAILDNTTASFTTAQETKLTGIQTGATANSTDAQLRDRSTHTGTQLANTISDFQTQVSANSDLLNKEDVIATQTFLRYVSASGNDLTGKGTISKPYATYSKTLTGAQFPLTIFQSGQTITENLTLSSSQSNFNIKGYTGSRSRNNSVLSGTITTGAGFTRLGVQNLQFNGGASSCVTFASGDLGRHTFENVDFVSTNISSIVFPTNYSNWCNFYNCDFSSCTGYLNLQNLSSGSAILRLYDCGFVSISIGSGWTVYTNGDTQLNIISKSSTALHIDLKTIRINSIITNQTTLNAIIGMASGGDGAYIVNFASPTGITGIQQGDIIWKVGSVQGILYKFIDAPASVIVWVSASTQQTYNKDASLYWALPVSTITIADNSITNAKLSQVATQTLKGRNTTGTGNVEDLSVSMVRSMLLINNVENTLDANKNVLSATKLTTPRTINGVAFDGTANITITDTETSASIYDKFKNNIIAGNNVSIDNNDINKTITINASGGGGGGGVTPVNIITADATIADNQEYFVKTTNNNITLTIPNNASNDFSFKVCLAEINITYKLYINLGNNIFIRDERGIAKEYTGTIVFAPYARGSNISTMLKKVDGKFRLWIN